MKKYTLNTKSLYGIDTEVELYNVFYAGIIVFSVLPDLEKQEHWKEVSFKEIEKEILNIEDFRNIAKEKFLAAHNSKNKELNKYFLVIQKNGGYWIPKNCLFEYFREIKFHYPIRASGTDILQINQPLITFKEIQAMLGDRICNIEFMPEINTVKNNYLSETFASTHGIVYKFWTLEDGNIADYYNYQRGIGRFAYIPKKGIVGGSYDFYFSFTPKYPSKKRININLTSEQWKSNCEQEKIMWAKELFPERQ